MSLPRRPDDLHAEKFTLGYDHGQLTADTTVQLYKVPAGRTLRLDRVSYVNPTGLAADSANTFALTIQNDNTIAATVFNTDSDDDDGDDLPADDFVEATLSTTSAHRVFQAGEVVSAVFIEGGTATLPAGHLVLEGRLF